MGAQDSSFANGGPTEHDLSISAAAPVVRDESKHSEEAVARETRSSTSGSQDMGSNEKLQDRQKGLDNLEKDDVPPYPDSEAVIAHSPIGLPSSADLGNLRPVRSIRSAVKMRMRRLSTGPWIGGMLACVRTLLPNAVVVEF